MGGREKAGEKIDSFALAQKVKEKKKYAFYAPDFESAVKVIKNYGRDSAVVVFMGAGDIDKTAREYFNL